MIFFITLFRYFTIVLFFTLHFFSFSQGMQTRERAHCARSVFPFIKKKKKKTGIQIWPPGAQLWPSWSLDVAPGPSSALLALSFWALAVKMTFAMTTSLLHVVDWTRGSMCVWVALDHRRLPFASRPSSRVSEESSRPCRALQICLRTIWSSSSCLLTLEE